MSLIALWFAAGVILLAFEVVVPGAILGIIGGICMLAGVIAAFAEYGFTGGAAAAAIAMIIVGLALYLEFVFLPKSRLARKFSMGETVAGTSQPPLAARAAVLGKRATAVTALAPSGVIEVEGRRYEAFCRSGLVRAGEPLEVVDLDAFRLIVSKPAASTLEKTCPTG